MALAYYKPGAETPLKAPSDGCRRMGFSFNNRPDKSDVIRRRTATINPHRRKKEIIVLVRRQERLSAPANPRENRAP